MFFQTLPGRIGNRIDVIYDFVNTHSKEDLYDFKNISFLERIKKIFEIIEDKRLMRIAHFKNRDNGS